MQLHDMMRVLRQRRNYTQADCAKLLGVAPLNYGRRERGAAEFTLNETKILLDLFRFDSRVLFDGLSVDAADLEIQQPVRGEVHGKVDLVPDSALPDVSKFLDFMIASAHPKPA